MNKMSYCQKYKKDDVFYSSRIISISGHLINNLFAEREFKISGRSLPMFLIFVSFLKAWPRTRPRFLDINLFLEP